VRRRYYISILLVATITLLATVWILLSTGGDAGRDVQIDSVRKSQARIYIVVPMTLKTVPAVERVINASLVLPSDISVLGPAYRVLGAQVIVQPRLDEVTGYDGVNRTFSRWMVHIILWNRNFVNGTTTNREILENGGVVIEESSAPAGVNSTRSALSLIAPPELCRTDASGTVCETVTSSSSSYIINVRGMAVIVFPRGYTVVWLDDKNLRWYDITSQTIQVNQLLILAKSMIPQ
jgi:hypothetical protein